MTRKKKGTVIERSGGGIRPWGARRTVPPVMQLPITLAAGTAAWLIFFVPGAGLIAGLVIAVVILIYLSTR